MTTLTETEEAHVDAAFLALSRLRDAFVRRDNNHGACRVDEAMSALAMAFKENLK